VGIFDVFFRDTNVSECHQLLAKDWMEVKAKASALQIPIIEELG
jgi:hypothetical protein